MAFSAQYFPVRSGGGANSPWGVQPDNAGTLWVTVFPVFLLQLRRSDGALLGTFTTGTNPNTEAFDGTNIWVNVAGTPAFGQNALDLYDGTGAEVNSFTPDGVPRSTIGTAGLVFDGASMWCSFNSGPPGVSKLDPTTGAIQALFGSAATNNNSLVYDHAGGIWVADFSTPPRLIKLRQSDAGVLLTNPVNSFPASMCYDNVANLWVTDTGFQTITKRALADGSIIGTYPAGNILGSSGICSDGSNIWIGNDGDNSVTILRISDGANMGNFPLAGTPNQFSWDGSAMWASILFDQVAKMTFTGIEQGKFEGTFTGVWNAGQAGGGTF